MKRCESVHPLDTTRACLQSEDEHVAHMDRTGTWPNVEVEERQRVEAQSRQRLPSTRTEARKRAVDLINEARHSPPRPPDYPSRSRIVRHNDPSIAHLAAEGIEPSRGTKKAQALALLRARIGQWVDAVEFLTNTTGGATSGTRRVRDLRNDDKWPIDIRRKPGAINTYQYRLRDPQAPDDSLNS